MNTLINRIIAGLALAAAAAGIATGVYVARTPELWRRANVAQERPYPRLASFGGITGTGWPLTKVDAHGAPVDSARILKDFAKYDLICLPPDPFAYERGDVVNYLRGHLPGVQLVCHVIAARAWWKDAASVRPGYLKEWAEEVERVDGYLYGYDGKRFAGHVNINLALLGYNADTVGAYVLVDALVDNLAELWLTERFDGLMIEHPRQPWGQDSISVDFKRAGFETWQAKLDADAAAFDTLWAKLRRRLPGVLLIAHSSLYAPPESNGPVLENAPRQHGGLIPNMASYLDAPYASPRGGVIFVASPTTGPVTVAWKYAETMAAMGQGYAMYGPAEPNTNHTLWRSWVPPYERGSWGRALGPAVRTTRGWKRSFERGEAFLHEWPNSQWVAK